MTNRQRKERKIESRAWANKMLAYPRAKRRANKRELGTCVMKMFGTFYRKSEKKSISARTRTTEGG